MKLFLIGFVLISASLFAQSTDTPKEKKWAIGLSFSPDYGYELPYHKSYKLSTPYFKENHITTISFGINAVYKMTKRLGLELSVFYATKGKYVTNNYSWITPGGSYDPAIPNSGGGSTIAYTTRITYSYNYLEIPLKLNFYVLNKRFKIFPAIGFATNVFLGKTTMVSDGSDIATFYHNYNKANIPGVSISLVAGLGFSYDISKRLFVKLEPNYRQFVGSIVDSPISGYFYSIGCNTGLYCRF